MSSYIFSNARIIDGTNGPKHGHVVVEGDRIVAISREAPPAGPDQIRYDLGGRTLMPGMVAGHAHLSYDNIDVLAPVGPDMLNCAEYLAVVTARNAATTLNAGFTSAIGAGCFYNLDVVLKKLIADGHAIGPRLVASGKDFCATGFPIDYKPEWWNSTGYGVGAICDGPEEYRKAVRLEAKRGVEMIKLFPEGGHGFPGNVPRMSPDEVEMAARTAHECGIRIRAHVHSRDMIWICLKAGVDILDHADHMDGPIVDECARRGTFVLPSLLYLKVMSGITHSHAETEQWLDHARHSIPLALKAGVRLVAGDDIGVVQSPHGNNAKELAVYTDDIGIDPLEVLRWATVNGAAMMQRDDIGRIEAGCLADLLVIDGDPLDDMNILADAERLLLVMQGGRAIKDKLDPVDAHASRRLTLA